MFGGTGTGKAIGFEAARTELKDSIIYLAEDDGYFKMARYDKNGVYLDQTYKRKGTSSTPDTRSEVEECWVTAPAGNKNGVHYKGYLVKESDCQVIQPVGI